MMEPSLTGKMNTAARSQACNSLEKKKIFDSRRLQRTEQRHNKTLWEGKKNNNKKKKKQKKKVEENGSENQQNKEHDLSTTGL